MAIDDIFNAVGNQIAAGERIEHTAMPHGDTVINGNRVEFLGYTARRLDVARHHLT